MCVLGEWGGGGCGGVGGGGFGFCVCFVGYDVYGMRSWKINYINKNKKNFIFLY